MRSVPHAQCWLSAEGHVQVVPAARGGVATGVRGACPGNPQVICLDHSGSETGRNTLPNPDSCLGRNFFFFFFNSPNETEVLSLKG